MGKQIDRRGMRASVGPVALMGAGAAGTMASSSASAQAVEIGGQAYVAIQVASWQLTTGGQALVALADGSTHSLDAGQFQIIDGQFYALESLVGTGGSALFEAGLIVAGGTGALVLGALALTAGGDGGANDSPTQAQGTVLKGPLSNAFVYYDANGNGQFDTDEKYMRTEANGTYDLDLSGVTEHAPNAAVIVTTDDQTVDTGAGTVLAGITLKATAGSSVVTPLTTLMVETGLGSDALGQALGLTGNQDLSAFNPFADGVDANQALATEQASAQVASTLAGLASAAIGAGADAEAAYAAALAALRAVVEAQANAGTPLDLSQAGDAGHLDEIQTAFTENIAGAQGLDAAALDAVIGGAVQAIGTVNDAIGDLDDTNLTADRNKGAFGLIQVMQDDIEQAARTGGDVTLADITADALETLIANLAPTDIALVGVNDKNEISIAEDTGSLSVGAISATDTDADSSGSVRFEIALVDGGAVTPESSPFEIDAQNNLLFTAQPDFETKSSYRVTVHATDTGGKTYAETFVIKITDANEVPVAVVDSVSTNEDTALVIDVSDLLANDSDVDGGTLSIASVSNENNGTVVFNEDDGTITFTPAENFNGDASFEYSLSDGQGGTATGTVNVTVNAVNDAPVAVVDSVSTDEDTALVINVADLLGNDSDVDGDTLSITAVDNGNNGTVVLNEDDGTITFTPTENFNGDASFEYSLSDGQGGTATGTVNVTVNAVNDAPVAVVDSVSTDEDTALVINVADLLANDSDVDGDTLSITAVGNGNNGTVVLNEDDGTITFTPTENFNGDASFEYSLSDGQGGIATGTVNVTVNAVNDAPVSVVDSVSTNEDTALVIDVADLLANDSDVDGDTLSITAVGNSINGTAVLNGDGTITFTPTENFNGDASFEYSLSDGQGGIATGTVNVTVNAVNDAPVSVVDSVSTDEDTALVINVTDLLGNDSDVDGDTLSIASVSNGNNGTVVFNEDEGTITFTPTDNFNGDASFEYSLSDGQGGIATGTVNVTVNAVNDAAEITGDTSGSVAEDGTLSAAGTLSVTDVDSGEDVFIVQNNSTTTHGSFSINAAGAWTYSLNNSNTAVQALGAGETLTDNISVTSADGTPATISITIEGTNDAPVAVVDSVSTNEDTALVINVADLLANDSDVDGDTLSITAVGNGNNGTVVLNEDDGTITFTPTENFNGDASFEYSLSDGQGGTATGTVNVTVNAVPVAVVDSVSINEDTALVINVADLLANDSDVDGDTLSITAVGNGNNGTVVLNEDDGTITFTPAENFNGDASFEYSLSDGQGGTATGTVNVTVNAVNDAPVAVVDSVSTDEDTALVINVTDLLGNDSDVDGDTLSIASVSNGNNGTVVLNEDDGTITFTPTENFNGDASFEYSLSDGQGGTATGTVNVTVNAVNDAPVAVVDSVSTDEDTALVINVTDLLGNDSDVDGDTLSIASVSNGNNGTVVLNEDDGTITFTPTENFNGDASFEYSLSDGQGGIATGTVNVTVNAVNDAAEITGDTSGSVAEDGTLSTAGTLRVTDVDSDEEFSVQENNSTTYGSFSINAAGAWTYSLNNSNTAVQALGDGESLTDNISVTSADGTPATISITIQGANDVAIFTGEVSGTIEEDTETGITGILTVTDVDGDDSVRPINDFLTEYGTFWIKEAGQWGYSLDNNNTAVQALGYGESLTDSITVTSADGTDQQINISITGINDAATFTGTISGTLDEDSTQPITGKLRVDDVDGENTVKVQNAEESKYGTFAVDAVGDWTFTLNNEAVQELRLNDELSHSIEVEATDGTTQDIVITIVGVNDAPVLQGDSEKSFNVDERDVYTGYALIADDPDINELPSYALSGADAHLFAFDPMTGELVFTETPNFENPLGSEGGVDGALGNTYVVEITAYDSYNGVDTETVRFHVQDVDEPAPVTHFLPGSTANGIAGYRVSILGDVNGDSIDDYFISAPDIGTSYVVFGTDDNANLTDEIDLAALASGGGVKGFTLTSGSVDSVAAGDIDGDGLNDIILGAPYTRGSGGSNAGATYVLYGKNTFDDQKDLVDPFSQSINLALDVATSTGEEGNQLGFVLEGAEASDLSGMTVASTNNDPGTGADQIVIGAIGVSATIDGVEASTGRTYVIQGQSGDDRLYGLHSLADVGEENGLSGFYSAPEVNLGLAFGGLAVSASGDFNNDSIPDFVGMSIDVLSLGLPVAVVVMFGQSPSPSGPVDLADTIANPSVLITGFETSITSFEPWEFNQLVSIVGDINNDGVDDLVVGDPVAVDSNGNAGRSYVIFGQDQSGDDSATSYHVDLTQFSNGTPLGFIIEGDFETGELGFSVAAAGDVNGDEIDDFIVTAPGAAIAEQNVGAAFVIFGHKNLGSSPIFDLGSLDGTNGFVILGGDAGIDLGTSVATQPGDINNDGFDDIILGAREWYDGGEESIGGTHIIYGQALFDSTVILPSVVTDGVL